ncbi:hypothetical protein N0V82_004572 [Gnomoniopsis sp. IMI 355080]|nr:hypothetical protein N0V82_004572 [Gnomoniopsis sp. IMI 355080]
MGRGGDWPPNSLAEWVVGQNFRPKQLAPEEGQKPILKVELSEDEASGDDILSVTYPGRRRRAGAAKHPAAGASGRKVRFDGDRKPLKSALKKASSSSSSDTTLVDTSDDECATFTDSSSNIDTSEEDAPVRRRRGKSKKAKAAFCEKIDSDDSSAAKDALPHPTCKCDECVKGRKILKAVIKFEAKTKAAERAAEHQSKGKNKGQQKGKKDKSNETSEIDGDTTDANTTEDEQKSSPKGKKNKKQKQKQKTSPKEARSSPAAEPPKRPVNKELFRLPEYPKEMQPNLIMRPEARVMQIEHAFETPYDPRPNAFYDNGKGITRVYHGPKYANPNGKLYANYDSSKAMVPPTPSAFPVGAMQNPYTPWIAPGAPGPGPSFVPNPAMFSQMPDNEEAMKKYAGQGFGLSGLPPPSVPPYFKEMQKEMVQQTDWQKSGSDKGSKKRNPGWSPPKAEDTWQKTGSDKGSKKGDATWGAMPGWGNEDSKKTSKKGGSQKHGSNKDWNGGGDNTWGANDNQNSGGWGGNNNNESTWGANDNQTSGGWEGNKNNETTWGATGDNNSEQKPSSNAPQAPPNSRPPSAANGSSGNGGGGDWGNNGNKAVSAAGGNWGNSGNAGEGWGATSNKNGSPQQFSNDPNNTWGGPPGSFPRSTHNSRPGSNAGGNDVAWGNSGHHTNGKGSEYHHSDPKESFKGAFDWPLGSGPPVGFNDGGPGSRRGSKAGWQGLYPANPPFGAFRGSQQGGADLPAGDFFFHSNSGPSDWTNKPSDQATGPSNPPDWRNPDAAQNTGGKAMNW